MKRPKFILDIIKKASFLKVFQRLELTTKIFKYIRASSCLENKIPSGTNCRVQVVNVKVLACTSLEQAQEIIQDQMPLTNQGWL